MFANRTEENPQKSIKSISSDYELPWYINTVDIPYGLYTFQNVNLGGIRVPKVSDHEHKFENKEIILGLSCVRFVGWALE